MRNYNLSTFNIYDDGKLIFTGTEPEIHKRFGLKDSRRLSWYAGTKARLNHRYHVEYEHKVEMCYHYNFYENGKLVFSGTSQQFKKEIGVQFKGSASAYATSHSKIKDRFDVEIIGQERNDIEKKDRNLTYLVEHLSLYRNTYTRQNPEPYLEQLKEMGFNCCFRKSQFGRGYIVETI